MRTSHLRSFAVLLAAALLYAPLHAAPQDPDPSFGTGGIVQPPIAPDDSLRFERLALLADERIAMVGSKTTGPSNARRREPVIAVLAQDGSAVNQGFLFDRNWVPAFTPNGEDGWLNRLLTLPDGSLLYCGGHTGPGGIGNGDRAVLGRLKPDLTPDTDFGQAGTQGWRTLALGLGNIDCLALEQLPGGSILIGGSYVDQNLGQNAFNKGSFLAMFDAQGQPVGGFGSNGVVTRLRQPGATGSARYGIVALRHQAGGSVLALDMDRSDAVGGNQVYLVPADGSLPANAPDLLGGADFQRDFYLTSLPDGRFQVLHAEFDGATARRFEASSPSVPVWERFFTAASLRHRPAGLSLMPTGRSLVALHRSEPAQINGGVHSVGLRTLGDNGQVALSFETTSGLPVPPGQQEILDPADTLVQVDGRYLVLMNRELAGAANVVQRPVLRRFLGNDGGGSSWSLDLLPDALAFAPASVRPNQAATSEFVVVSGLSPDTWVPVDVSGGELQRNFGAWTTAPVLVRNDDVLRLRGIAPGSDGQSATVRLRAGGLRQSNSWNRLAGSIAQSDFVISASQPTLPGVRCNDSGLNSNCTAAIPDNSAGGLSSTINLIGACSYITGVRVGVDIAHPHVGDLQITLRDPNGQEFIGGSVGFVRLMNRPVSAPGAEPGSCSGEDVLASFEQGAEFKADEACGLIPSAAAIAGSVGPTDSLSSLVGRRGTGNEGADPNGIWTLILRDRASGDVGQLNDWSIDVDCSATPPALSDLAVQVVGPPSLVAGRALDANELVFTVTNNGPERAQFGRFEATLPALLDAPFWRCIASAGSSCVLPPGGCTFNACPGPLVNPGLDLLAGGSATIEILGTPDALASEGSVLGMSGEVWIAPGIGGSRDPNGDNDRVVYARTLSHEADLVAVSIDAELKAPGSVRVDASFRNDGPSIASAIRASLGLPSGYQIQSWSCDQAFAGFTLSANQLVVSGIGSPGNGSPLRCSLSASFAAPQPTGNATLLLEHGAGSSASDPDGTNNFASTPLPTSPPAGGDAVFANGFE